MILFYTNSTKHLVQKININKGKFIIKKFTDGEIYVKIKENVKNKKVWVLASTNPPGDHFLELIFLLDALKRAKAKINLLIPYFGYARQDSIVEQGEAFAGKVIADLLTHFTLNKIIIIHMHSRKLKPFLHYVDFVPVNLFEKMIKNTEILVAPDKGAVDLVRKISKMYKLPFLVMDKIRIKKEKTKIIKFTGDVRGKKVLIVDDLIATGSTILEASKKLQQAGAKEICVIATHGIFADKAIQKIQKDPIKQVYVTNSLLQKKYSTKIKIINIAKDIETIMKKAV